MDAKWPTPRYIITKIPKVKERNLISAREKKLVTHMGVPISLSADFSKETLRARRDWQEIVNQSHEKQGPTAKIDLPSKTIIWNQRADKEILRQEKK